MHSQVQHLLLVVFLIGWVSASTHGQESKSNSASPKRVVKSRISFTDVTAEAGVPNIPEMGAHAACWVDVNGDGWEDLYVTNIAGQPNCPYDVLYMNKGNGTFVDESLTRGLNDHYDPGSHGAVFADLDNDGDFDAFISTTYLTPDYRQSRRSFVKSPGIPEGAQTYDRVYRNDGKGRFTEIVTGIPKDKHTATRQVLAGDIDNDGDVDLYATNQLENPRPFGTAYVPPLKLENFFINDQRATFSASFRSVLFTGFTQGATFADIDGDGDLDLVEAKWAPSSTCYLNDGHGQFTEVSAARGLPVGNEQSDNGITFGDVDNDGDLDMAVAGGIKGPDGSRIWLYRNDGSGHFDNYQTIQPAGKGLFMVSFGDLDHDQDLDMYVSGGNVYENDGSGNFKVLDASSTGLSWELQNSSSPRASGLADYDNDGDLDIYVADRDAPSHLLRNNINNKNWLKVKLTSPRGELGAMGAKVTAYTAGQLGNRQAIRGHREVIGAYGYCAQDSAIVHFGLPANERFDLRIRYLTGEEAILCNVAPGRVLNVVGCATSSSKPTTLPASKK